MYGGFHKWLTGAERREWMGMGEWDDYEWLWIGSFPHSRSEAPVRWQYFIGYRWIISNF